MLTPPAWRQHIPHRLSTRSPPCLQMPTASPGRLTVPLRTGPAPSWVLLICLRGSRNSGNTLYPNPKFCPLNSGDHQALFGLCFLLCCLEFPGSGVEKPWGMPYRFSSLRQMVNGISVLSRNLKCLMFSQDYQPCKRTRKCDPFSFFHIKKIYIYFMYLSV